MSESTHSEHCDTCRCFNASSLDTFSLRGEKLVSEELDKILDELPSGLVARIRAAPRDSEPKGAFRSDHRWSFGFTGWKLGWDTARICGQFLCTLHDESLADRMALSEDERTESRPRARFFVVNTYWPTRADKPTAHEHNTGDVFDISDSPWGVEVEEMTLWSDEKLRGYLRLHLDVLREAVEAAYNEANGESSEAESSESSEAQKAG